MHLDKKICPVCAGALEKEVYIEYNNNSIWVECGCCGTYTMSREFYEDHVEAEWNKEKRTRIANFLKGHKCDKTRPFLTNSAIMAPTGFQCYPYHLCVLSNKSTVHDR